MKTTVRTGRSLILFDVVLDYITDDYIGPLVSSRCACLRSAMVCQLSFQRLPLSKELIRPPRTLLFGGIGTAGRDWMTLHTRTLLAVAVGCSDTSLATHSFSRNHQKQGQRISSCRFRTRC